jgi:hypothetical protein
MPFETDNSFTAGTGRWAVLDHERQHYKQAIT